MRGEGLKTGLDTTYQNISLPGERSKARNLFEIGPSFTIKPSPHTRLDVAPLCEATGDAPRVELFVIFSVDFGTGPPRKVEGPAAEGDRH
jgi:hypothetical protein